jgi:transposase InsO family protein
MSQLRKQLMELLPEIQGEAKSLTDSKARQRYRDVKFVTFSGQSVEVACKLRFISRDYFEKWAKRILKLKSLLALVCLSRRPKSQPKKVSLSFENRVCRLRRKKPFLGPGRIWQELGFKKTESTIYRILKRNSLISRRRAEKLTKKHLKRYRRPLPGYLQMDFKYVPYLINSKQYYQLSCVDHHSSWRFIRIYANKDLVAVEDFLLRLEVECPFPIFEIQTDNDTAFTDKFWTDKPGTISGLHLVDEWCASRGIRHKLIPVGEKEINGKVENTHKQDDRELFSQIDPSSFGELEAQVQTYEWIWNKERRTRALNWLTPEECIENAYVAATAWCLNLREKYYPKSAVTPKKPDYVSRYLKWLEEDAKKYGNYLLILPLMSRIFSLIYSQGPLINMNRFYFF